MKGLLKNNFYGVIENLKIALAFVMLVGVLLLITGEATLLSAFSLIAPPIIALLMVSCVRKESASKWEKYKLTLPVRRKAIIESQYISHTIWSISGVVIVAVFMTLTVFIHGDQYFYYGFRDAITLVLGGGILAILIGAFSYPLYYLWGAEKTEVILIISVIGSIGIVFALTMLVNTFSDGNVSDTLYYISLLVVTAITILVCVAIYAVLVQGIATGGDPIGAIWGTVRLRNRPTSAEAGNGRNDDKETPPPDPSPCDGVRGGAGPYSTAHGRGGHPQYGGLYAENGPQWLCAPC